jgi:serine kinase of HPr protein (carbohydrate metabolism regulator)
MITVNDLIKALDLTIYSGAAGLDNVVSGAYVCDLLSDVMGNARQGQVWLTLQTHKNVMAVASLKELPAVILVKGLQPEKETAEQSDKEKIPMLGTKLETFEITGKLFKVLDSENTQG